MSKKINRMIRKPITKKEVVHESVEVMEPIRKRGRPKKIDKPMI